MSRWNNGDATRLFLKLTRTDGGKFSGPIAINVDHIVSLRQRVDGGDTWVQLVGEDGGVFVSEPMSEIASVLETHGARLRQVVATEA